MNKKILGLSAIALSMALSHATYADPERTQHFSGEQFEKIAEQLNLNADQKEKIKVLREKAEAAIHPKVEELHSLRIQTNDLLSGATLDEAKLDNVINEEKEAIGSILKIRAMERYDISNVLTAQQKTTFTGMIQQWEKKQQEQRQRAIAKD